MTYIVVKDFYHEDRKNVNLYKVGDIFPRGELDQESIDRVLEDDRGPFIVAQDDAIDYLKMTVAEIKAELEKQGIEYDSKARKDELISLF